MKEIIDGVEVTYSDSTILDDVTLRDWFAGQALCGYVRHEGDVSPEAKVSVAQALYEYADAMLAERERKS